MSLLDQSDLLHRYDASQMLNLVEQFPQATREAIELVEGVRLPHFLRRVTSICFTGLGGSAIGADLIRSYLGKNARVPIVVNRHYTLPGWVSAQTLVVVCSYSGDTEETLESYRQARRKKAQVIAITSGGRLRQWAQRDRIPWFPIPQGLPPRAAVGYSFVMPLALLASLGICDDPSSEILTAAPYLEQLVRRQWTAAIPTRRNLAKQIALRLHRRFPIIYGGSDLLEAVVTRWRGQLAENAKTLSSSHLLPEMNHNEIVGWRYPDQLLKACTVILLRDRADHPRVSQRFVLSKTIIRKARADLIELWSRGQSRFTRISSLILLGDLISVYLAVLNRVDPTPVEAVRYLKRRLAAQR